MSKSLALKWHFFSYPSSISVYCEYFNLFMRRLGFNPAQIGFTTLLGLPSLLVPLFLLLGENFRARKTVLVITALALSTCCILPLSSLTVPVLQPSCNPETSMDSIDTTQQIVRNNAPVHLTYDNSGSMVFPKSIIYQPRSNMTMTPISK